jgi:hypothetical protein
MSGLLLLSVFLAWLIIVACIAAVIVRILPKKWWSYAIAAAVFLMLMPLPLIDEINAKPLFQSLCSNEAKVIADRPDIKGRTTWFDRSEETKIFLGSIPVRKIKWIFVDSTTQEPVYHYVVFEAQGGRFMKFLGISETGGPLLFNGTCAPPRLNNIPQDLEITEVSRQN